MLALGVDPVDLVCQHSSPLALPVRFVLDQVNLYFLGVYPIDLVHDHLFSPLAFPVAFVLDEVKVLVLRVNPVDLVRHLRSTSLLTMVTITD